MPKLPYMQFYAADWLTAADLTLCSASTRGIWIDALCAMHLSDQCGSLSGSVEKLARICRCTVSEMRSAIDEIRSTKAGNISERDGNVTLVNRRMQRLYNERVAAAKRMRKHRKTASLRSPKRKNNAGESELESESESDIQTDPPADAAGAKPAEEPKQTSAKGKIDPKPKDPTAHLHPEVIKLWESLYAERRGIPWDWRTGGNGRDQRALKELRLKYEGDLVKIRALFEWAMSDGYWQCERYWKPVDLSPHWLWENLKTVRELAIEHRGNGDNGNG